MSNIYFIISHTHTQGLTSAHKLYLSYYIKLVLKGVMEIGVMPLGVLFAIDTTSQSRVWNISSFFNIKFTLTTAQI